MWFPAGDLAQDETFAIDGPCEKAVLDLFMKDRRKHSNKADKKQTSADRELLKRGIMFCVLAVLLNIVGFVLAQGQYLFFFNIFNAETAGALMRLTGIQAVVKENIIHLSQAVWVVDTECTAINLINLFAAFILVYPAVLKDKAIGVAGGIAIIFTANMIRLLAMAWVAKLQPDYFPYFHDYVWQVAFLIMIAFLWLFWIDKVVNRACQDSVPA